MLVCPLTQIYATRYAHTTTLLVDHSNNIRRTNVLETAGNKPNGYSNAEVDPIAAENPVKDLCAWIAPDLKRKAGTADEQGVYADAPNNYSIKLCSL